MLDEMEPFALTMNVMTGDHVSMIISGVAKRRSSTWGGAGGKRFDETRTVCKAPHTLSMNRKPIGNSQLDPFGFVTSSVLNIEKL
jgi:hypothetical protein